MPDRPDNKQILDEYEKEILDNWYGKKAKRKYFFSRFNKYKDPFKKIAAVAVTIFFIWIFYRILITPPRYNDQETETNGRNFETSVSQTGIFQDKFYGAISILKEHPYFYKKVVNNINEINIGRVCPYMCVSYCLSLNSWWDLFISPPFTGNIPLTINPGSLKTYNDDYKFASALVHEADHIEYSRSGKIRKLALTLKCNPVTNFRISIDSAIPSIIHRISAMEICAQKEQIEFHKITDTKSGYEIKNGMLYNFGRFVIGAFKFFFNLIFSIFRSFF